METTTKISFEDTAVAFAYKPDEALKKANFIFTLVNHPWVSAAATWFVNFAFKTGLPIETIIRKTAFQHFCGGETIEMSVPAIERLAHYGVKTILDYSVEGGETEQGFDKTLEEILRTVENAKNASHIPFAVFKVSGLGSVETLTKIQNKETLTEAEQSAYDRFNARVNAICETGYQNNVPVLIDAEDSWYQDTIDGLVYKMMRLYNQKKVIVYNTYQLYRTQALKNLKEGFHTATMHNYYLGAKLVRGAYMEKERERAAKLNYPSPIHATKEDTDNAFNQALLYCLDNKQRISLMCGSHNEYSNYFLTVMMEKHSMQNNDKRVWFAQLYGMSDNISFNLAQEGYNVAKYVPYGPIKAVMPYLLRRAEENTSVAGQSSRELKLIRKELSRRRKKQTTLQH